MSGWHHPPPACEGGWEGGVHVGEGVVCEYGRVEGVVCECGRVEGVVCECGRVKEWWLL